MIWQLINKVVAAMLALTLLLGSLSKDWLHLFADHHDTTHCGTQKGVVVENEHHHCSFLQFTLAAYDAPIPIQLPQHFNPNLLESKIYFTQKSHACFIINNENKGPPIAEFTLV